VHLAFDRVLFAGAHLDDIEFGAGAWVADLAGRAEIRFLTLTQHNRASDGRIQIRRDLDEPLAAARALGLDEAHVSIGSLDGQMLHNQAQAVRETFLRWRSEFDPEVVVVPAGKDIHQDHHVVYEEAVRIFRDRTVLGFEVVRSTLNFTPNLFVDVSPEGLEKKVLSVLCYRSQLEQSAGYYFKPEILRGQAYFRGGQSNKKLAEAFEVYFLHHDSALGG
jgi:N-acetylglucosamine malate deacetylase 1